MMVALILVFDLKVIVPSVKTNPSFQYGHLTAVLLLFTTIISFIGEHERYNSNSYDAKLELSFAVTLGCLVLNQRYKKRLENSLLPENGAIFRCLVVVHILT